MMLASWQLDESNLVGITTDNGSNIMAAAREAKYMLVPCFGHVLHNAINCAMQDARVTETKGL